MCNSHIDPSGKCRPAGRCRIRNNDAVDIKAPQKGSKAFRAAWIDSSIPAVFLVSGFVIGLMYAFVLPPLQVTDEIGHFARIYSVSTGDCIASTDVDMPMSFEQLQATFPSWLEKTRRISVEDLQLALKVPLNEGAMAGRGYFKSFEGFVNQNQLSCIPYLPAAAAMNAGRHLDFSPLALMYLVRITNLLVYVGMVYLGLRLLPDFRMLLFCIALLPMAMQQAASASADSFTFGITFLFFAYIMKLACDREPNKLSIRQYMVLALLVIAVVLSKSMVTVVLLILLIPAQRFGTRRNRWIVFLACVLLALALSAGWQHANEANFRRLAEERLLRGWFELEKIDVRANIRFMYEHPLAVAAIFFRTVTSPAFLLSNISGAVGYLGWLSIQLPEWLVWLYIALLLAAVLTQVREVRLTLSARVLLVLFILAGTANTMAAGWVLETPKFILDDPATWENFRVYSQGRYWIPVVFPVLVLVSHGRTRLDPRLFAALALAVILMTTAVAIYFIKITYYY